MRVLVCGGRSFGCRPAGTAKWTPVWYYTGKTADRQCFLLQATLDALTADRGITTVIHGAATGADDLAGRWARRNLIAEEPYKADWKRDGRAAGPIRNARMLAEGKPDLVVAFPGGRGTEDMKKRAQAAGIEVIEVSALGGTG